MKIDVLGMLKPRDKTLVQIAKYLRVGITTINNQVMQLKEEGLINSNLKVTKMGELELQEKQVSNVIILAAGWGSRMSPATDNTPKPMVKIFGESMIETTIKTLHKAGMTDISIVIGKEADKFNFLAKKYNVKLVMNNEWNKRNNIASLEKVKDILSNTLILEGDAPIYAPEIILKYINDPMYYGSYMDGPTAEWSYAMRGNNIIGVHLGGEDTYIWKGGWYTNKYSSNLYRKWFKENYDNPMHRDANAAFILLDILKHKNKKIRLYRINDSDMVECDTFEELCQIDSIYKNIYNV